MTNLGSEPHPDDGDDSSNLQRTMMWAVACLGAAVVLAAGAVGMAYLPLPHNISDAVTTGGSMLLIIAVLVLLYLKVQCSADQHFRRLEAKLDDMYLRVSREVEEAKTDFHTRQDEDRMALQERLDRNLDEIRYWKSEHRRREWNAVADGAEMVLGGRDVVESTGTTDIAPKMRKVVPMVRPPDCRS